MTTVKTRQQAIDRLYSIRNKTHQFARRVEFACLAYQFDLSKEISNYSLWDAGYEGLGERQLDSCFEMGDAELVIHELLKDARAKGYTSRIKDAIGDQCFARWEQVADFQGSLF